MIKKTIAVAAVTFVALGAIAFAHSGATGIYKERMDAMAAMGKVVKELSTIMRGEADYDAAKIQEGARLIQSHAGEAMTAQFPEGTTKKPSEARAQIWSDWDTFSALAEELRINAEGLEKAASNGLAMQGQAAGSMMGTENSAMMGGQSGMMSGQSGMMADTQTMMTVDQLASMPADGVFNMVAQTCSACHTKFRLEKK